MNILAVVYDWDLIIDPLKSLALAILLWNGIAVLAVFVVYGIGHAVDFFVLKFGRRIHGGEK